LQALASHICEEDQPLILDVLAKLFTNAVQHLIEGRLNHHWVALLPFNKEPTPSQQTDGLHLHKNPPLKPMMHVSLC
jgi:hypothetical protein